MLVVMLLNVNSACDAINQVIAEELQQLRSTIVQVRKTDE